MQARRPKAKFAIFTNLSGWVECTKDMEPKPVKLPDKCPKWLKQYKFFTHRETVNLVASPDYGWCMTEVSTGMKVASSWETRGQAEAEGIRKLLTKDRKQMREAVKKSKLSAATLIDQMRPQCDAYRSDGFSFEPSRRCEHKAMMKIEVVHKNGAITWQQVCNACFDEATKRLTLRAAKKIKL